MKLYYEAPDVKEYHALRTAAGLSTKDDSAAARALSHSLFSIVIRSNESELMGMGRVIGDGGCTFQIVDIIVNPAFRDVALNELIIHEIKGYLNHNAPKDADIIVMADAANLGFYQKHDFKLVYPELYGMSLTL
ncbi:GNAT family N-acetyltransferase [Paenibacillus sepulcri]|uniref:GNAT family N-acetyltransferase n=1 Tax=Paenibacillus sepulcri TaxID=359917 RepID=A0ABS7CCZ2_9BACL|nr:GNAT family N-acetyltransferase [Paenibacillus sepulcri]